MPSAWTWNPQTSVQATSPSLPVTTTTRPETELRGAQQRSATQAATAQSRAQTHAVGLRPNTLRERISSAAAQIPVLAAAERLAQRLVALGAGTRGKESARPSQKILTSLSLGGRRSLTLVEMDGQRYLVGCGAESVTTILPVPAGANGLDTAHGEQL